MCHPKRKLHGVKNQVVKKEVKKSVKKSSESQEDNPNDAEYFFLMNEDILH
jgi:hypothetical protein